MLWIFLDHPNFRGARVFVAGLLGQAGALKAPKETENANLKKLKRFNSFKMHAIFAKFAHTYDMWLYLTGHEQKGPSWNS